MNPGLWELHQTLLRQHQALADKLGAESDSDSAKAILLEMRGMLRRVDLVQSLLFRETSKALEASLGKIRESDRRLTKSIREAVRAGETVKVTSRFLQSVDKAIAIARTLAAA